MNSSALGTGFLALGALFVAGSAGADTPASIASSYQEIAQREVPGFTGLSASRGQQFFQASHGNDWSCASCHTANPLAAGNHARTNKTIAALAPSANPARFTDLATVEKWFRRNCGDVLGRPCTAKEKGDVLTYLISLKP